MIKIKLKIYMECVKIVILVVIILSHLKIKKYFNYENLYNKKLWMANAYKAMQ